MKKVLAALLGLGLVLSLSACKLEHNSRVKYSQLTGEVTTIEAMAKVEVPNCHDIKDKTKLSEEIIKTNDLMAKLFPGSEFEGCKNEGIESLAAYTIPMEVGAIPADAEPNPKGIAIYRHAKGTTFFFIAKEIRERITQARKNVMTSDLALKINVKLSNNTDKQLMLQPIALFVDGVAYVGNTKNLITVSPSNSVILTLSDVSSEYAIEHGFTPIFREVKEQPQEVKK